MGRSVSDLSNAGLTRAPRSSGASADSNVVTGKTGLYSSGFALASDRWGCEGWRHWMGSSLDG
jgi:hypothetical protein